MQTGDLVELLFTHTFDPGICRVDGQRNLRLCEPVVQGLKAPSFRLACIEESLSGNNLFKVVNNPVLKLEYHPTQRCP